MRSGGGGANNRDHVERGKGRRHGEKGDACGGHRTVETQAQKRGRGEHGGGGRSSFLFLLSRVRLMLCI